MNEKPRVSLREARTKKGKFYFYTILLILSALYILGLFTTPFSVSGSAASPLDTLKRIFIVPLTDMDYIVQFPVYIGYMIETVAIAYAGVTVATILAIPWLFSQHVT